MDVYHGGTLRRAVKAEAGAAAYPFTSRYAPNLASPALAYAGEDGGWTGEDTGEVIESGAKAIATLVNAFKGTETTAKAVTTTTTKQSEDADKDKEKDKESAKWPWVVAGLVVVGAGGFFAYKKFK